MRLCAPVVAQAVALAVLMVSPVAADARQDPVTEVREGDVISAAVVNSLVQQLRLAQGGYGSAEELLGSWSCVTFDNNGHNMCPRGAFVLKGNVYVAEYQLSITREAGTVRFSADVAAPGGCGFDALGLRAGSIEVYGGNRVRVSVTDAWQAISKLSATQFSWDSGLPYAFTRCSKVSVPPAPVAQLDAAVNALSVRLTWQDQSSNETGFRIQRKSESLDSWTTIDTVAPNTTMYSDAPGAGTFWYRVISTNQYGDSVTSSEVRVAVIQ